ncbi:hypothetical protein DEO72_LG3g2111 [Vigna unguiculata]|uniref:Uncharacterized protein n=1 Tax=Vigna unguiculata TaxID=3917 RepID=A0A4D6LHD7_VIGUN|nr:hypothetical protein DEO72_LG3g2111 [Vigna unguiculata]
MARSVTNAGYGLIPQRFAGRNDNEAGPSNTHITALNMVMVLPRKGSQDVMIMK